MKAKAARALRSTRRLVLRAVQAGVLAIVILVVATTTQVNAAGRYYTDGRVFASQGNVCESYLPGDYRVLTVKAPSVTGFKLQWVNTIRVTPTVQYSWNLTNPSWQNWFALPTHQASRNTDNAAYVPGWTQQLPNASEPYVVRTVYKVQWAITNANHQIIGWTSPVKFAEDISHSTIWVGTNPVPLESGCLIH